MPVHASAVAVSSAPVQKAKTWLFMFNALHTPVSLLPEGKVFSLWHQFLCPRVLVFVKVNALCPSIFML